MVFCDISIVVLVFVLYVVVGVEVCLYYRRRLICWYLIVYWCLMYLIIVVVLFIWRLNCIGFFSGFVL